LLSAGVPENSFKPCAGFGFLFGRVLDVEGPVVLVEMPCRDMPGPDEERGEGGVELPNPCAPVPLLETCPCPLFRYRPLRLVSAAGTATALIGILLAVWLVYQRLTGMTVVEGWTSALVTQLLVGGLILFSLGVIAEYVGMAASMSMGKPLYVAVTDPAALFEDERDSGP
jgi:hypothetical protein